MLLFNYYILRYFMDINNNIQLFIMVAIQKYMYFSFNVLYNNLDLFKCKPIDWKVVYNRMSLKKVIAFEDLIPII